MDKKIAYLRVEYNCEKIRFPEQLTGILYAAGRMFNKKTAEDEGVIDVKVVETTCVIAIKD